MVRGREARRVVGKGYIVIARWLDRVQREKRTLGYSRVAKSSHRRWEVYQYDRRDSEGEEGKTWTVRSRDKKRERERRKWSPN